MTAQPSACPHCTAVVRDADRFCESCGAALSEVCRAAIPRAGVRGSGVCTDCGGETFIDDYCAVCGTRSAPPDRDEAQISGIALITDRGHDHARNEDAAAAAALVGADGTAPHAVVGAVCDGVSTSADAQLASGGAATAGVDAMVTTLAASRNVRGAVIAGLTAAAEAATRAASTPGVDPHAAPACTYTAVAMVANPDGTATISVGNVGDSRTYWLPHPPARAELWTVDDSVAQELINAGVSADSEAVQRGAHTLTRWLGVDGESAPWSDPSVTTKTVTGPGLILLCSDGLWNYLPDAADIAQFCIDRRPVDAARALTDHALEAGGEDNITVVVIPIGGFDELT